MYNEDLKRSQNEHLEDKNHPCHNFGKVRELSAPAKTRFAYAERTVEAVLLAKNVLRNLFDKADFESNLWQIKNEEGPKKRDEIVDLVNNREFFGLLTEVLRVLSLCRRNLRLWDSPRCSVCSVYRETLRLGEPLRDLKTNEVFT